MCGRGRYALRAQQRLSDITNNGSRSHQREKSATRSSEHRSEEPRSSFSIKERSETHHTPGQNEFDAQTVEMVENLSPGMVCPVVIQRDDDLVVEKMTWGLIPAYVPVSDKPNHFALFNKRTDSLFAGGYFRKLVESKRCLIVLDGFYEWKTVSGKTKQPYYVSCGDEPLQIAGIYERSKRIDALGNTVIFPTFSMLTGDSSAKFTALHHREPVLLTDDQALRWLDTEKADLDDLLRELVRNPQNSGLAINSDLGFYPVTPRVGKASYQEPDCTAPVAAADRPAGVRSIDSFFKSPSRAPAESSPSSARKTKRTHEGPSSPSSSSPPSPAKKAKRGTIKDFFGK